MPRWEEKNDITSGPNEEDFLLALAGDTGNRNPIAFRIRPRGTKTKVLIERIERYGKTGFEYIFYGQIATDDPLYPCKVRGWYAPNHRHGGISFRARPQKIIS